MYLFRVSLPLIYHRNSLIVSIVENNMTVDKFKPEHKNRNFLVLRVKLYAERTIESGANNSCMDSSVNP